MNRTLHPLLQLLLLFALCFGLVGVFSVLMIAVGIMGVDIQSASNLLFFQGLSQLVSFVIPVVVIVLLFYRNESRPFLRFDFSRRAWLLALAGLAVWGLMMPLMDWSTVWNDNWHFGGPFESLERLLRSIQEQTEKLMAKLFSGASVGSLVANLIVIALFPAISEELFFRAGVQNIMLRWVKNPHVAVWITAAIFSLFHGEIFAFVPRLLMGVLLGYLYFGSNSMVPNMVAHFFNNAAVVVFYWFNNRGVMDFDPESSMAAPWPITLGCTVAALAVLYLTFGKNLKISQ